MMRVLHMFTNPHLTNGATMFEYRVSQFLKEDEIFFDYLVTEQADGEELERYKLVGSDIYKLPIDHDHGLLVREIKINYQYYKFFRNHKYDIVYADTENALRSIHLLMARFAGVPVRVVHSHNTGLQTESKMAKRISRCIRGLFRFSATDYFACSDMAAEWLFPKTICAQKKYKRLTNGVDLKQFEFRESIRDEIRSAYGIGAEDVVIGNVGRFMPQKNHSFMLKIFDRIYQKKPNAKLMLIGNGPLQDQIQKEVEQMNLQQSVVFVGTTPNVMNCYQAMDVFLMPSLFEGLPITGIEAQANGLPCVFADTITQELKITQLAQYCSLEETADTWADIVIAAAEKGRTDCKEQIVNAGYSIDDTVSYLKEFYLRNRRS